MFLSYIKGFAARKHVSPRFRINRKLASVLAIIGVLWIPTAPARADFFVDTTFSSVNPGEVVTITNAANPQLSESGWAGVYNFVNTTSNVGLSGNLNTFCIDIGQDINFGQKVTFGVANLSDAPVPGQSMGQTRANIIGELWYQDYAKIGNSNSNAAAFQIAIWEIVNETTRDGNGNLVLNVNGGTFHVSDDSDTQTLATANIWLSYLDPTGKGTQNPGLIAMTSSQYQDYVVQGVVTPTPAGWILGAVGFLGLYVPMAVRFRRS